jgi:hypothetical protein
MGPERFQRWSARWVDYDRRFYLSVLGRLIEAAREPWPKKLVTAKQVSAELSRIVYDGSEQERLKHLATLLLMPAANAVFDATGRTIATRDAMLVILAVEQFRRRNGELPRSLDQLVPTFITSVPNDPFDGQPLRYRLDSDQYLVYSIGDNLEGDGGVRGPDWPLDVVLSVKVLESR